MPIIIPKIAGQELFLKDNEQILKPEEFLAYKGGHLIRKRDHHNPPKKVDTSNDPETVFFKVKTLENLLMEGQFQFFVFFIICESGGTNHKKLSVMVAGFDQPAKPKTRFYQASNDPQAPNQSVNKPVREIQNYISRCEAVGDFLATFNPYNEYKGYAHLSTGLIKSEILDKQATDIIVYFGVNPQSRLTVMLVPTGVGLVPLTNLEEDMVIDNGTMCCPIP